MVKLKAQEMSIYYAASKEEAIKTREDLLERENILYEKQLDNLNGSNHLS